MDLRRMFGTVRSLAKETKKPSIVIFFDVIWCGIRYGAGYVDYKIFDFARLTAKQRRTFVTRGINNEFIRKLNNKDECFKFEDKTVFNGLFRDFIGREWVCLKDVDKAEFERFLQKHKVVIAKPIDSICGKGIEKIDISREREFNSAGLYDRLVQNGQTLVEECIVQHEKLSAINASSVNTIRLMTIVKDGNVHVMFRALRVGIAGSAVDNFNAGGMFVLLDENGVIVSHAVNKQTEIFEKHPSSGVTFKGYTIPFFKEVENTVKKAALVVPGVRYVSWDIAVDASGRAVIIEGNHNPGYDLLQSKVYLMDNEYGRLPDFVAIAT